MLNKTVTCSIETETMQDQIMEVLADPGLIPRWAPGFADKVESEDRQLWKVTKGESTFQVELVVVLAAGTVDYVREVAVRLQEACDSAHGALVFGRDALNLHRCPCPIRGEAAQLDHSSFFFTFHVTREKWADDKFASKLKAQRAFCHFFHFAHYLESVSYTFHWPKETPIPSLATTLKSIDLRGIKHKPPEWEAFACFG